MAVYTELSEERLRILLAPFRLGPMLSASGVAAGTVNTIYDVRTTRGRFFVRILENRSARDAAFEVLLLTQLEQAGLPVAQMLSTVEGERSITVGKRKFASVFPYVRGRELTSSVPSPKQVAQIGSFLARMHLAARGLPTWRKHEFGPAKVRQLLSKCAHEGRSGRARAHLKELSRAIRYRWPTRAPWGIIHGDLFRDNARYVGQRLNGVLDFEMAGYAPLIYDIAVALGEWAFDEGPVLNWTNAVELVRGYESLRPIGALERRSLPPALRFAAARFATTRYFDFESGYRVAHDRLHKDYRDYLARLRVWQRLDASYLLTRLFGGVGTGRSMPVREDS